MPGPGPPDRFVNVHFSDAGCLILGFDRDIGGLPEEDFMGVSALRPFTEQVVRTLNPYVGLDDVTDLATRLGCQQDGSRARTVVS
ncbi:hypothetical protein [Streptomyces sp. NPDC057301]|uniref:hypothetical protein n=1 Tax=Streptomyces sp. NPDC057301 TaxID=3346093 RepID=UPI00363C8361